MEIEDKAAYREWSCHALCVSNTPWACMHKTGMICMRCCVIAQFNAAMLIPKCLPAATGITDFCKSTGIVLPAVYA